MKSYISPTVSDALVSCSSGNDTEHQAIQVNVIQDVKQSELNSTRLSVHQTIQMIQYLKLVILDVLVRSLVGTGTLTKSQRYS